MTSKCTAAPVVPHTERIHRRLLSSPMRLKGLSRGISAAVVGSALLTLAVACGGPSAARVPSVVGVPEHQAEVRLRQDGFRYHIVFQHHSNPNRPLTKPHWVLAQLPLGGARRHTRDTVTLIVQF